jgi:hypothetical protein
MNVLSVFMNVLSAYELGNNISTALAATHSAKIYTEA